MPQPVISSPARVRILLEPQNPRLQYSTKTAEHEFLHPLGEKNRYSRLLGHVKFREIDWFSDFGYYLETSRKITVLAVRYRVFTA